MSQDKNQILDAPFSNKVKKKKFYFLYVMFFTTLSATLYEYFSKGEYFALGVVLSALLSITYISLRFLYGNKKDIISFLTLLSGVLILLGIMFYYLSFLELSQLLFVIAGGAVFITVVLYVLNSKKI